MKNKGSGNPPFLITAEVNDRVNERVNSPHLTLLLHSHRQSNARTRRTISNAYKSYYNLTKSYS